MPITATQIDPRDETWQVPEPAYRVYFWDEPANTCDEWELDGADVEPALDWARSAADGRTFKLYAVVKQPGEVGLIRVHGTDPTAP